MSQNSTPDDRPDDRQLILEQAAAIDYLSQQLANTLEDGSTPEQFKVLAFSMALRYAKFDPDQLEVFLQQNLQARQQASEEMPFR